MYFALTILNTWLLPQGPRWLLEPKHHIHIPGRGEGKGTPFSLREGVPAVPHSTLVEVYRPCCPQLHKRLRNGPYYLDIAMPLRWKGR
jgi:hypothetical protein